MTETSKFVDWLATTLHQAGTRRAFGVPGGGSSLDLIAALRNAGIETTVTAREDAAIMMAGVSGVLGDAPGVAFTTKGPGLASGANGLACAALDRLPVLLISEAFEPGELGYLSHQMFDQNEFAGPLLRQANSSYVTADVQGVSTWLADALGTPHKPGVMLPNSRDYGVAAPDQPSPNAVPAGATAAQSSLAPVARAIAEAKRPIIVVGLGAARRAVTPALRAFAQTLGAPVLCTYMAKGCVADDHPQFAGIFTGGAIEQSCVNDADLIVLVGLDPVELIRKPWPYDIPVVDLNEVVHSPHYIEPQWRVVANLAHTLSALEPLITPSEWTNEAIGKHRERFLNGMTIPPGNGQGATTGSENNAGVGSTEVVTRAAAAFTNADGALPRLAVDAGAHMFSACAFWPCHAERDLLISNGLATMGFALPAGLAAAVHDPKRGAVAMTGDGGVLMCLGELKTAAQTQANLTTIVFNDGRLSLIDIKRQERQMSDMGMSWDRPDFATIARGFGHTAWQAKDSRELAEALDEASHLEGPKLIDVWIDSAGYSDQLKALRG